jgi:hypothetical protein
LGWRSSDLAGVGKDGGVRGRSGAVEDRRTWWLEGGAARWRLHRWPRVAATRSLAGGRGGGAPARRKNGRRRRKKEERQGGRRLAELLGQPKGCAAPRPHHPGWSIGAPARLRRLMQFPIGYRWKAVIHIAQLNRRSEHGGDEEVQVSLHSPRILVHSISQSLVFGSSLNIIFFRAVQVDI